MPKVHRPRHSYSQSVARPAAQDGRNHTSTGKPIQNRLTAQDLGCGGEGSGGRDDIAVAGWATASAMGRAEATATAPPAVAWVRAMAAAARVTAAAGWAAARAMATTAAAPARAGVIVAAVN